MPETDVLQLGDEIQCVRCNKWHVTYIKYPNEPAYGKHAGLYFECAKRSGSFFAGRVGEAPREPARWRRRA